MNPNSHPQTISHGQIQGQLALLQTLIDSLERTFKDLPPTQYPKITMIDANISHSINHFKDLTKQLITKLAGYSHEPAVLPTSQAVEKILHLPPSCQEAIVQNGFRKSDSFRPKIYRSYTKEEKNHSNELQRMGLTAGEVSKELGIPLKNVRRWYEEASKVEDKQDSIDHKMEQILLEWIHSHPQQANSSSIRKKAVELSSNSRFRATNQWLGNFRQRHKLTLQEKKTKY